MIVWTLHRQQQQCGAQVRRPGEAPREAVKGREAQDHERAGGVPQPGESPASQIENRDGDPSTGLRTGDTPSAPDEPDVEWDNVVQPEHQRRGSSFDRLPLPEGK
jgi:hypothetical protein